MERAFRGPDVTRPHLTSQDAADWIGVRTDDALDALMAEHLPTVPPVWLAGKKHWRWEDVAVLAYVLGRATIAAPRRGGRKDTGASEDE